MSDPALAPTRTAAGLCDVADCRAEWVIQCGSERRCYAHALERGNELRAARGLPAIVVDEQGAAHVIQ